MHRWPPCAPLPFPNWQQLLLPREQRLPRRPPLCRKQRPSPAPSQSRKNTAATKQLPVDDTSVFSVFTLPTFVLILGRAVGVVNAPLAAVAASENVLLEPNRNVLLTGSGWGGGKHRSSPPEAAGSRPVGGTQAGAQAADPPETSSRADRMYRTASAAAIEEAQERRRQSGDSRTAGAHVQPQAQRKGPRQDGADSLARGVPRLRPDAGGGVPGQPPPDSDRVRGTAQNHAGSEAVARPSAQGRSSACVAPAAEFARRTGAVGHFRSRLAGRARRRKNLPDPHDRRRHQRTHPRFVAHDSTEENLRLLPR